MTFGWHDIFCRKRMKEEINNTKGQRAIFCGSTLCGAGIRDGSKLVNFGSASRLIQLEPGHLHSLINNIEKSKFVIVKYRLAQKHFLIVFNILYY